MFLKAERRFYQQTKGTARKTAVIPQVQKFLEFWAGILEDDSKTEESEWMREIGGSKIRLPR